MKLRILPLLLLVFALLGIGACSDKAATPVNGGGDGDFFPKPIDNENKTEDGLSIVRNKQVNLSFENSFGALTKTVFIGEDVLSPSCFIAPPGNGVQAFKAIIKNNVSLLQVTTNADPTGAGNMIHKNFYDVVRKAQDTGAFQTAEADNSLFKNVAISLKFAGVSNNYLSSNCSLKAQSLVILEEGPEEGPDVIHALTFKAECKSVTEPGTSATLTNVVANFTCLVSESP